MKIVIASGGTGGHLFPAIKVARELRAMNHDVLFLGSFTHGVNQLKEAGFAFEHFYARGLTFRGIKEILETLQATIRAMFKSFSALKMFKPHVVLGFGGYGAFPVVMAAALRKIPTMIHEQNVVPGRANRVLAHITQKIAVSFKESLPYFSPKKVVWTGCPPHAVKQDFSKEELLKGFHLNVGKKTILVFGGSQGSQRINQIFLQTAKLLKKDIDFQVIHLCGKGNATELKQKYALTQIDVCLFEFLDRMEKAYVAADLVICRSGAVTVSEVAMFGLPAIFIPYPYALGHQKENAMVLVNRGLAEVIEERFLTEQTLRELIIKILASPFNPHDRQQKMEGIFISQSARKIAVEAVSLVK